MDNSNNENGTPTIEIKLEHKLINNTVLMIMKKINTYRTISTLVSNMNSTKTSYVGVAYGEYTWKYIQIWAKLHGHKEGQLPFQS